MVQNYDYSWQLALLCYFVYMLMLSIAKPTFSYKHPHINSKPSNCKFFFLLLILINVFSFWEYDTYHTWELFNNQTFVSSNGVEAFEEVYNYISKISNGNYFLWRFIIWGTAFILIYLVSGILNIRNRHFLTAVALFIAFAGYSRVILGCSILVFGSTLLFKRKNILLKILALSVIFASYFFHKSMYVYVIFAVLALLPIKHRTYKLLLYAYPFLTTITTYLVNNNDFITWITELGKFVGGNNMDGGLSYIEQERAIANSKGIITQIITVLPTYLSLLYIERKIVCDNILYNNKNKAVIQYLFKISFISVYIASLFYFTETSSWIYIRFMNMAVYPLTIVLAYLWTVDNRHTKWTRYIIIIQLIGLFIVHFTRLYNGIGY